MHNGNRSQDTPRRIYAWSRLATSSVVWWYCHCCHYSRTHLVNGKVLHGMIVWSVHNNCSMFFVMMDIVFIVRVLYTSTNPVGSPYLPLDDKGQIVPYPRRVLVSTSLAGFLQSFGPLAQHFIAHLVNIRDDSLRGFSECG